ncbi:MAG: nucleobase:cation symporter-2 NCS2 family [bacterium]|nr:MAG: nucleobase:cation symporter-2 NCS2 family [bacterium]KAF0148781.1 MAG: nucleobase:cation symporter-2 NCS2 family [bacterium]KAF0167357.1 MAG: nucleobase:cation symporter-2 NCS2 family [bacterium]TXT20212.1 MAG: nucleobase:cation symporter-2 NCS2 family [bacterium]
MAKLPENLIYGVDDKPPVPVLLLLGMQHIFLMSSTLVLPVVLVTEIGGGFDQVRSVVALTRISCGLGTIFQAMRFRWVGSGYLCPNLCGPNFFAASMSAAWLGGLPLMRGMTIVAGLVEIVFARALHRIKFLFPPEITGLVVLMVAVGVIPLGVSKFLGVNYEGEPIQGASLLVAFLTLLTMVGVNVWGKGRLKLYSVLAGMVAGYLLALGAGQLTAADFRGVASAPWVALPRYDGMLDVAFSWSLLPVFVIVSITGALKSFGNLIMCEKVNDAEWKAPNTRRIGNGLMADAFCVTASGMLGGVASDTSASNVAFSSASGATSRRIGYVAGALFIVLGFFPKVSGVLSVMPMPVMGAILIFVTSFMIVSGIQIILGAGMDNRRTFVIGISIIFGLSLDLLPSLYAGIPVGIRPLFESSLTLCTVLAVVLNQVLRLGAPKGSA